MIMLELDDDDKVIAHIAKHPDIIKRYMKEKCNKAQLNYWAREIELILRKPELAKLTAYLTDPHDPKLVSSSSEQAPIIQSVTRPSHSGAITSSLPGMLVLGYGRTPNADALTATTRLYGQSVPVRHSRSTTESNVAGCAARRVPIAGGLPTTTIRRTGLTRCGRRPIARGDMAENDSNNIPASSKVSNRTFTNGTKSFAMTSSDTTSRIFGSLNGRNLSQSNHHANPESAPGPVAEQGMATYHPLRSSVSLSSQLLRATKSGYTNKELIFSDLTASICEIVPVDGSNLYLVDNETNSLYLQPPNQPIRGSEFAPLSFEIGSRKTFACYAAELRKAICNDDLPKDILLQRLAMIPNTKPKHMIAHPIKNAEEKLIGVIEVYRSASRRAFSQAEKLMITTIVHWTQLVLESNEKLLALQRALQAGDFILEVIRSLFSKVKNMDNVIQAIMEHAKELVKADRVTLFSVDSKKNELFSSILDMGDINSSKFVQSGNAEIRFPITEGFAGYVVRTGKAVRSDDVYGDPRFYRRIDEVTNHLTKTLLAMPLFDNKEVVGVLEMINKVKGVFTDEDERLLNIYSTYCGLAINVARMYDRIYRSDQKYRVALEVLTYHSLVSEKEVEQAESCLVPQSIPGIASYDFSPWSVEEKQEVPLVCFMVNDLAGSIQVDKKTLVRFTLTVRKNYRPVSYHNWDHGLSVAHSMYYLLKTGVHTFTELEKLSLFIACLCHDLDHRGYDNRFMKKFSTPLAALYSSSPMEHHHFNMTVTILQQRGHNIFANIRSSSYRSILAIIKHAILSTDLATFWGSRNKLEEILDSEKGLDWSQESHRMSVISIAMPTCDLCAMYKPWDIQVKVVMLIMQEFWAQGDREKASDSKPLSLMDRDEAVQLADGQVGFIRGICLPCYSTIARVWPTVTVIIEAVQENMSRWEAISKLSYEERERQLEEHMRQCFPKIEQRNKRLVGEKCR